MPTCLTCGSTRLEAGGFDGDGNPITVCSDCGDRQEAE